MTVVNACLLKNVPLTRQRPERLFFEFVASLTLLTR